MAVCSMHISFLVNQWCLVYILDQIYQESRRGRNQWSDLISTYYLYLILHEQIQYYATLQLILQFVKLLSYKIQDIYYKLPVWPQYKNYRLQNQSISLTIPYFLLRIRAQTYRIL